MREARLRRTLAVLLVLLVAAGNLPWAPASGLSPVPQATQLARVLMYLHANNQLTVVGNAGETSFTSFTQRQWDMPNGLLKTACIEGNSALGMGNYFFMFLNITVSPSFTVGANVTASLKDEGAVIATQTVAVSRNGARLSDWNLDYTANRTSCDVLKGHKLQVEVTSDRLVGTEIMAGAFVDLYVWDVFAPTASTRDASGPSGTFYPNDIDGSRTVVVAGLTGSAFEDALVRSVTLRILDPVGTAVANASGASTSGNYSLQWTYNRGIPSGTYTAAITVTDLEGDQFNTSATFTVATYGLRITIPGSSGGSVTQYTAVGTPAEYEVTVINIGASPTGVQMATENSPAVGWTTDFSDGSFPLEPGASHLTYFHANPSSTIGAGNSTQITIVAQASSDPAPIKARAFFSTTTIIRTAITIKITPHQTDGAVKLGGTARYDFRVNNSGGLPTDVLFNATAAPAGWERDLDGVIAEGGGWRLVGLPANGEALVTLGVLAPNASTGETTFVCTVSARSAENTSAGDTFVATTRLLLGIEMRQDEPIPTQPKTNPGAQINFLVELTNTDPLNRHDVFPSDITFAESATNPQGIDGQFGGSITLDRPSNCCEPGQSGWLTVTVRLPTRSLFGVYEIQVFARVDGDPNRVVELNLSLQVVAVYSFSFHFADDRSEYTLVEGTATIPALVENAGNVAVEVRLKGTIVGGRTPPLGWTVVFVDENGDSVTSLSLPPYTTAPVNLTVTAARDALNGDSRKLNVTLERVGSPPYNAPAVTVTVDLSLSSSVSRMFTIPQFVLGFLGAFAFGLFALWLAHDVVKKARNPPPPKVPAKPAAKPGAEKAAQKGAPLK